MSKIDQKFVSLPNQNDRWTGFRVSDLVDLLLSTSPQAAFMVGVAGNGSSIPQTGTSVAASRVRIDAYASQ